MAYSSVEPIRDVGAAYPAPLGLIDVGMTSKQVPPIASPAQIRPHPPARRRRRRRSPQPAAATVAAVAAVSVASAGLRLRLSAKAADGARGAATTARAGHGGALRLHQVPPALSLRGAVSGAAAVQGARAGAAAGAGTLEARAGAPGLRGRPARRRGPRSGRGRLASLRSRTLPAGAGGGAPDPVQGPLAAWPLLSNGGVSSDPGRAGEWTAGPLRGPGQPRRSSFVGRRVAGRGDPLPRPGPKSRAGRCLGGVSGTRAPPGSSQPASEAGTERVLEKAPHSQAHEAKG